MGTNDEIKARADAENRKATLRTHQESLARARQEQINRNQTGGGKSGCFVATAAFGDYNAPEVLYLSAFRDQALNHSPLGRAFVRSYYKISPPLAAIIANSTLLRLLVRGLVLKPIIFLLRSVRA
jgi:hypothetical protein